MNKHKAVKHEYRGMKFDSGRELKRWKELEILESTGKIKFLHRQVPYVLAKSVVLNHRRKPALRYVADFVYYCNERGRRLSRMQSRRTCGRIRHIASKNT